jgi:hypothetical protein
VLGPSLGLSDGQSWHTVEKRRARQNELEPGESVSSGTERTGPAASGSESLSDRVPFIPERKGDVAQLVLGARWRGSSLFMMFCERTSASVPDVQYCSEEGASPRVGGVGKKSGPGPTSG